MVDNTLLHKYFEILAKCRGEFDDHWGDILVDQAQDSLVAFGPDDWKQLADAVDGQPEEWLYACADSLSASTCPSEAIAVLVKIAEIANESIKLTALDSIRIVLKENTDRQAMDPNHLAPVLKLLETAKDGGPVSGLVVSELRQIVTGFDFP